MASAQSEFYTALRTKILAEVPEVKYCKLWNNQLPYNERQESFEFPCVFIEFANIDSMDFLAGVMCYKLQMIFHIGISNYELEDLDLFELKDKVDKAITTTLPGDTTVTVGWIPLNKTAEFQDSNDTSVYIFKLQYDGTLMDLNTSRLADLVPTSAPIELTEIKEIVPNI